MRPSAWIHLPRIVWKLLWDRRVPFFPKLLVTAAAVYLLLPTDMLPDMAFGWLGYLDDLALLILAVAWLLLRSPKGVLDSVRRATPDRRQS